MAKIFVCGDITNESCSNGFIDDRIAQTIRDADYSICNLEGPELNAEQKATFPHQVHGTVGYLNKVGFDLMLLANNHIAELGLVGIRNTIDSIKEVGADYIGAGLSWDEAYHMLVKKISGLTFGFVNVCEAQVGHYTEESQPYGYAWMGYDSLINDIKKLSKDSDFVIAFVHAGLEHYPIPLPEIRDFYRVICDAGASVVVGGHTHCVQGWEKYHKSIIVYSLGNFFFPYRKAWEQESHSYSILLNFEQNKDVAITPVFHYYDNDCVRIDNSNVIDMDALNDLLGDKYDKQISRVVSIAYNNLCKRLLLEATCGEDEYSSINFIVKNLLKRTIFRKKYVITNIKYRETLLLRLFENETYRWVIIRYLKNNTLNK